MVEIELRGGGRLDGTRLAIPDRWPEWRTIASTRSLARSLFADNIVGSEEIVILTFRRTERKTDDGLDVYELDRWRSWDQHA